MKTSPEFISIDSIVADSVLRTDAGTARPDGRGRKLIANSAKALAIAMITLLVAPADPVAAEEPVVIGALGPREAPVGGKPVHNPEGGVIGWVVTDPSGKTHLHPGVYSEVLISYNGPGLNELGVTVDEDGSVFYHWGGYIGKLDDPEKVEDNSAEAMISWNEVGLKELEVAAEELVIEPPFSFEPPLDDFYREWASDTDEQILEREKILEDPDEGQATKETAQRQLTDLYAQRDYVEDRINEEEELLRRKEDRESQEQGETTDEEQADLSATFVGGSGVKGREGADDFAGTVLVNALDQHAEELRREGQASLIESTAGTLTGPAYRALALGDVYMTDAYLKRLRQNYSVRYGEDQLPPQFAPGNAAQATGDLVNMQAELRWLKGCDAAITGSVGVGAGFIRGLDRCFRVFDYVLIYGDTVELQPLDPGRPIQTYQLVTPDQSDHQGKLSSNDALGRSLLGRRDGDQVVIDGQPYQVKIHKGDLSTGDHEEIATARRAELETQISGFLSVPNPDAPPSQAALDQLESGERGLRFRAGRIVDLNARLQSAKAARDQENAQISYSVDQAYRSYGEYAAQIRLQGGSPMDPETYGQWVRSEEKEKRAALDEAVTAAERDLNQAFEGYSVLRIEVDGQPLWRKLLSLGPDESGQALILRALDQQAETTRQGILTWGVDASPQDKIVVLGSPPYSSVRDLISGDPTLQALLPDSTLTASMGVIVGAAASIAETEAYRKEVDKRLRWVVVPAGFLSGPLGWAFSIGIGVDATIAETEIYYDKVARAEWFQRQAEIGVITQSDLGDWNQPPSAWGVVFAVGGNVLDVVVPVAAGRVARALGPADDAARALRAADALDPADTSAASVLRGLDAPPVTPGGALAHGTVPARPGNKPPTDPHDIEAWNKYYEENPNAPRTLGAAAADDPAVFGDGSGGSVNSAPSTSTVGAVPSGAQVSLGKLTQGLSQQDAALVQSASQNGMLAVPGSQDLLNGIRSSNVSHVEGARFVLRDSAMEIGQGKQFVKFEDTMPGFESGQGPNPIAKQGVDAIRGGEQGPLGQGGTAVQYKSYGDLNKLVEAVREQGTKDFSRYFNNQIRRTGKLVDGEGNALNGNFEYRIDAQKLRVNGYSEAQIDQAIQKIQKDFDVNQNKSDAPGKSRFRFTVVKGH